MTFQSFGDLAAKVVSNLDEDRWAKARALRAAGTSWGKIVAATGISMYMLRCDMIPGFKEREAQKVRNHRSGKAQGQGRVKRMVLASQVFGASQRFLDANVVPDGIIEERERAKSGPLTLSQVLFGDPLPGRSALDKKRQQTEAQKVFG